MRTPLSLVAKTLKHNKRRERSKGISLPTNLSPKQQNKIENRTPPAASARVNWLPFSLGEVVWWQEHQPRSVFNVSYFLLPLRAAGRKSPPFTPWLLPHCLVTPIYIWSCSSTLATRETQGRGPSSRDGLLVQRAAGTLSRDPCRRSVGRTGRRRRRRHRTRHTDATGTPTFRMVAESG